MNPNDVEKEKIVQEWLEKSRADLESAEILSDKSNNYDIVVYHCHQAVEKYFKSFLLKNEKTFRFNHDLNTLFIEVRSFLPSKAAEKDISYLNSLYPRLRYPSGDQVTAEAAEKCLAIAKNILNR